jgi:CubicO group peptidase (beta-lactamase class C family)
MWRMRDGFVGRGPASRQISSLLCRGFLPLRCAAVTLTAGLTLTVGLLLAAGVTLAASASLTATDQAVVSDATAPAPAGGLEPARDLDRFAAYLDGVVAAQFEDYDLAGLTIALVLDGRLALSRGYGFADLEARAPVDPATTLFRPGSVSKLFTWTAAMQLVEQGRIELDAPLARYVDQFELPERFGEPLTMNHLMGHAPGLEDGAAGYLFARSATALMPLADSLALRRPTQIWAPGTYSAYSNWATALAGLVVANVSGERFEDYVSGHIFEPLGMRHATFEEPLPEALAPHMAQGYTARYNSIAPMGFEFIGNFGPAGALSASAEDMARFMIAHVADGAYGESRILDPETARQMHARHFGHDSRVSGMAHGFIEQLENGERFIGHGGDTIAFHSQLVIHPDADFGLFLSFNAPDGARARAAVVSAVIDYFFPDPAPDPWGPAAPGDAEGSAERIARVSGAYRVNRRSFTRLEGVIALGRDVVVQPGPEGEIVLPGELLGGRYVEVAPYEFRQRGGGETLLFEADDAGVSRLFIGSVPIIAADKLGFWESATTHQTVMALTLVAALFVLINAVRRLRQPGPAGTARLARASLVTAAAAFLAFAAGLALVFGNVEFDDLIFEFPPAGTGAVLALAVLGALATLLALGLVVGVWRSPDCNVWQRLRYSFVVVVFALFVGVLGYWNLLGWRY